MGSLRENKLVARGKQTGNQRGNKWVLMGKTNG